MELEESISKWKEMKERNLICPLCLEIFTDPVALICGHSFCKQCIEVHVSQNEEFSKSCPVCRENIIQVVQQFRINASLQGLCQEYRDRCDGKDALDTTDDNNDSSESHACQNEGMESAEQALGEAYDEIEKRVDSLEKQVQSNIRLTATCIDTVRRNGAELKRKVNKSLDKLSLKYTKSLEDNQGNLQQYLLEVQAIKNDINTLRCDVVTSSAPSNFEDKDTKFVSLVNDVCGLENDWTDWEFSKTMEEGEVVSLREEVIKGINAFCKRYDDMRDLKKLQGKGSKSMVGYLRLASSRYRTLVKDVPVYSLGSYVCEEHLNFRNMGLIYPHVIVPYGLESSHWIDMRSGKTTTLDHRDYTSKKKGDKTLSVSATAANGKTYLAVGLQSTDSLLIIYAGDSLMISQNNISLDKVSTTLSRLTELVRIKDDVLCYFPNIQPWDLHFLSIHAKNDLLALGRNQINLVRTVLTHLGSSNDNVVFYAVDIGGSLFGWPVYNNQNKSCITFNTTNCRDIQGLASDKAGNLWAWTPQNMVCFTSDGKEKYVLDINAPWLVDIVGFGISDEKFIFIRRVLSEYQFFYTPLEAL